MELGLSLGDTPKAFPLNIVDKSARKIIGTELGFCMGVGGKVTFGDHGDDEINDRIRLCEDHGRRRSSSSDRPVQLDLLPVHHHQIANNLPFHACNWFTQNLLVGESERKLLEVKRRVQDEGAASPNSSTTTTTSIVSSSLFIKMDYFSKFTTTTKRSDDQYFDGITANINHDHDDEDENGGPIIISRNKLRLTKQQSAFLEHSFKQHHTLNPKQKLALAIQLNLRPRQVEVWFQNRRARTKLKQTEVDCDYLRQCCETLTQDNKRLKKELQQLRALNNNQLYTHLRPANTLTMCPSCERVVASGGGGGAAIGATAAVLSLSSTTAINAQSQQVHPAS